VGRPTTKNGYEKIVVEGLIERLVGLMTRTIEISRTPLSKEEPTLCVDGVRASKFVEPLGLEPI